MDIVIIFNGLGNQMSQYAFYLAKKKQVKSCKAIFSLRHRKEHNGFELGRLFGIKVSLFWSLVYYLLTTYKFKKVFGFLYPYLGIRFINEEMNYDYNPEYLKKGKFGLNFYWGGWHSEKYFKDIQEEVKKVFTFSNTEGSLDYNKIKAEIENNTNSISIHIRRGDYLNVNPDDYYQLNDVATITYYKYAINRLNVENNGNLPTFYFFSNDPDWCKTTFSDFNMKMVFVTCNSGKDSWRDLYLMSLCHKHINANSTFSWWGAWLCKFEDSLTICPGQFIRNVVTKDFYPSNWIKIQLHPKDLDVLINYPDKITKDFQFSSNIYLDNESEIEDIICSLSFNNKLMFHVESKANSRLYSSCQISQILHKDNSNSLPVRCLLDNISNYLDDNDDVNSINKEFDRSKREYSPLICFTDKLSIALDNSLMDHNNTNESELNDYFSIYYFDSSVIDSMDNVLCETNENFICESDILPYYILKIKEANQTCCYFLNTSERDPIIEQININGTQIMFNCININKKLIPYIKNKY